MNDCGYSNIGAKELHALRCLKLYRGPSIIQFYKAPSIKFLILTSIIKSRLYNPTNIRIKLELKKYISAFTQHKLPDVGVVLFLICVIATVLCLTVM